MDIFWENVKIWQLELMTWFSKWRVSSLRKLAKTILLCITLKVSLVLAPLFFCLCVPRLMPSCTPALKPCSIHFYWSLSSSSLILDPCHLHLALAGGCWLVTSEIEELQMSPLRIFDNRIELKLIQVLSLVPLHAFMQICRYYQPPISQQ
jgi:hypothetical protein